MYGALSVKQGLKRVGNAGLIREARARAVGVLLGAQAQLTLLHEESKALMELKHDKDIVIVKADKGGVTVVLDRSIYDDKMSVMLGDNCTYKSSLVLRSLWRGKAAWYSLHAHVRNHPKSW